MLNPLSHGSFDTLVSIDWKHKWIDRKVMLLGWEKSNLKPLQKTKLESQQSPVLNYVLYSDLSYWKIKKIIHILIHFLFLNWKLCVFLTVFAVFITTCRLIWKVSWTRVNSTQSFRKLSWQATGFTNGNEPWWWGTLTCLCHCGTWWYWGVSSFSWFKLSQPNPACLHITCRNSATLHEKEEVDLE